LFNRTTGTSGKRSTPEEEKPASKLLPGRSAFAFLPSGAPLLKSAASLLQSYAHTRRASNQALHSGQSGNISAPLYPFSPGRNGKEKFSTGHLSNSPQEQTASKITLPAH
jgi:hypothetical protein